MGTVIKFPRARGRHKTPAKAAGDVAVAVVIILPVVRIERDLAERSPSSSGVKAKAARSVTRSTRKTATEPPVKAIAKSAARSKPRRKTAAPALQSPACVSG